jgi:hypothetical protein
MTGSIDAPRTQREVRRPLPKETGDRFASPVHAL